MEVEVKLYGMLRQHRPPSAPGAPHHPFHVSLPASASVATLIAQLAIEEGLLNAAAVNGEAVSLNTPLHPQDRVSLFPPAAGGTSPA